MQKEPDYIIILISKAVILFSSIRQVIFQDTLYFR